MIKVSFVPALDQWGQNVFPLFGRGDAAFEKTAAPSLLPEVSRYISALRPRPDAQYVLLNAMGASEWWGANVNADAFTEASLIHKPDGWTGNPLLDAPKSKTWAYGFPTFYFAKAFAHHRNSNPEISLGDVELAAWNPNMKRVELVTRLDHDRCMKHGGSGTWDKLKSGEMASVSMGAKVPFDTCSICLDWDAYRKAWSTYDPKKDKSPGEAILAIHKKKIAETGKGIRGVSITRKDYCEHMRSGPNKVYPDGRRVFVYNDFPRFFDISFVFVGADKTAKTMMKIAGGGRNLWALPGAELAEELGYEPRETTGDEEKTASPLELPDELKLAFLGKQAKKKGAEISKDVLPSQFAPNAVAALTPREKDLPKELLDLLGSSPLEETLSTTAGLGMVLRPREFQRIILVRIGHRPLADRLEREGTVFPKVDEGTETGMGPGAFSLLLARLLLPLLASRSAFGPVIEKRVLVAGEKPKGGRGASPSLSSDLLHKIGAAYRGYRTGVMELVAHAQDLMSTTDPLSAAQLHKLASAPADSLFTPLSASYLKLAFWDEAAVEMSAGVERATPSRNTSAQRTGGHNKCP